MTEAKVILITGAVKGIGRACALRFRDSNFKVALHYRSDEEKAKKLKDEIPNSEIFRFDLTETSACEALIKAVREKFGRIDILVNNAGMAIDQLLPFVKIEDFDRLIATNLKPAFLLSKLVAKLMIKQKGGRMINITSVVGHTGNPGQSIYAATKSALTGFTKSVASELAPFGILVNAVAPGFIETDMTTDLPQNAKDAILAKIPLKRMGSPEEVAHVVYFLASSDASYITGTTLHVNGGMYTT